MCLSKLSSSNQSLLVSSLKSYSPEAPAYFVADLHLDLSNSKAYKLALTFFKSIRQSQGIYILGDLFEYWIGDDAGLELHREVIEELYSLSVAGIPLVVMLGNRDFLLGPQFSQATGAQVVREDEYLIKLAGESVLLMHGDTLCTDDADYQEFRQQLRSSKWQSWFLSQTIEERVATAKGLSAQSKEHSANKTNELMDVTESTVAARLLANNCSTVIHGHTHRPAEHIDPANQNKRFVVGDWHNDHALYVVHDECGLQLCRFDGQTEI